MMPIPRNITLLKSNLHIETVLEHNHNGELIRMVSREAETLSDHGVMPSRVKTRQICPQCGVEVLFSVSVEEKMPSDSSR